MSRIKFEYFFGYHSVMGNLFPFKWMEEDGEPVGGAPKYLQRHQITRNDFLRTKLSDLEKKYPYQEVANKSEASG